MKFKLDENMPADLAILLREHEHDTTDVIQEGLAGEDDQPVLAAAANTRHTRGDCRVPVT